MIFIKYKFMSKISIYQVLPRLFGNEKTTNKQNGTIQENGCGKFNSFTPGALASIKSLGITHVWYTGVIEHATQTDYSSFGIRKDHPGIVKGKAGSAYAIKDYYDVDPDLAENVETRMAEFEALVDRTHEAGMKVIIDFVPNHVARQYYSDAKPKEVVDLGENDHPEWAFSPLNNFYYLPNQPFSPTFQVQGYTEYPAKATGNDQFTASPTLNDWYETVKLNYGVNYVEGNQKQFDPIPDTWFKMRDILLFWASKKIDGFRCDMAEMVPVEFWGWVISQIKQQYPGILFIAEVYNPAEYRNYICNGKFDYLYDKVGMYDMLRNVTSRNFPVREITNTWQALGGIENQMLNFLENHDEQRIGSGFFSGNGMYAQPAMIVAATLTQAPVMIYFGQELGEQGMESEGFSGMDGRTSIFDYWGLKSIQAWSNGGKFDGGKLSQDQKELQEFYKKLLNIAISEKAITDGSMYDLVFANFENNKFNTHEQFAYFRKYEDELLLVVLNFDDKPLDTEVFFPFEAFQYLGLEEGQTYRIVNLLNDSDKFPLFTLSSKNPLVIHMPAWKGFILRLTKA
ncbi:alpha amylase catalytic region [Paludibacter propionicigenes WB4]|uniref:Alpha amylase catalytic region n=2 Tax=Paludibacter TaxID=346096 RepID=E4T2W9_PALPW|nr:alpha amylase catalytic region [Paludibacter propionicigenes WB4]